MVSCKFQVGFAIIRRMDFRPGASTSGVLRHAIKHSGALQKPPENTLLWLDNPSLQV